MDITGYTATRMKAIEDNSIVDGDVNGSGHLILTKHNGATIDAGSVIGPTGPTGPTGPIPEVPSSGPPYVRKNGLWVPLSDSIADYIYKQDAVISGGPVNNIDVVLATININAPQVDSFLDVTACLSAFNSVAFDKWKVGIYVDGVQKGNSINTHVSIGTLTYSIPNIRITSVPLGTSPVVELHAVRVSGSGTLTLDSFMSTRMVSTIIPA